MDIRLFEVIKLKRDLVINPSPKFDPTLLQIRIMALPKAAYGTLQIGLLTIKVKDIQTFKSWKKFITE
ncbi:MAG: hypothetical protein ACI86M_001326 [Saprospiraceae bacterium]